MDTTLTYKCPNCSAGLLFDAEKQMFSCEFCLSHFTELELEATAAAEEARENERKENEWREGVSEYYCPSCGAEVIAEKSTVSDFCYYCHNPIVLSDKVTGTLRPSKIIPFKLSRSEAIDTFLKYAKSKWFVPRDYFRGEHVEKISGIYYPYWVTDADTDSAMRGRARIVRSWRSGDYRYTETKRFSIYRRGKIHFEDISTSALSTDDKNMIEGVLPYPTDEYIDFSMPYLQGFLAKKRDLESRDLHDEVKGKMDTYATRLLSDTVVGYSSFIPERTDVSVLSAHWEYCLMPVWVLTYKKRGRKKDKTYVYAMNGSTGKFYGELPVSVPKLLLFGLGVFLASFLLAFGLGMLFLL